MLNDLCNYLPISDYLATAGQPTAAQFAEIAQAGFDVIVNLALPTSDNALADERAVVEAYGLTYYSIPVEWEAPTAEDFAQFQVVLAKHAAERVLVHCAKNMRVSAFMYLHRRLAGVAEVEAAAAMAQIWQPNETWQQFIDEVLARSPQPPAAPSAAAMPPPANHD